MVSLECTGSLRLGPQKINNIIWNSIVTWKEPDQSRLSTAEDVTGIKVFKIPHSLTAHGKWFRFIVPFCINRKAIYAVSRTKMAFILNSKTVNRSIWNSTYNQIKLNYIRRVYLALICNTSFSVRSVSTIANKFAYPCIRKHILNYQ